jgi:pyrimidine operon attenuation protein/uracil phosphoribosyltransferase
MIITAPSVRFAIRVSIRAELDARLVRVGSFNPVQRGQEGARMQNEPERVVLDRDDLRRTLVRIAHEIVEKNPGSETVALVGIHTRGAVIARRLHTLVGELTGSEVPLGDLDISFYRDDLPGREPGAQPIVHSSHLDFDLDGRTVVLVDDVMFTGRTARAAIDALFDYGRPERVQLAVLADRGHRELPIRPDYVGKNLPTARDERVFVRLEETDELDEVAIERTPKTAAAGVEER